MIQRYKLVPDFLLVDSLFAAGSTLTTPINQPEGYVVRGNNVVYDPDQNILLVIGGNPANPYLFLYRYDNGDTNIVMPSKPTGNALQIKAE